MHKRTPIKLLSLLIALCLLFTSLSSSAVEVNAVNAEATENTVFQLDADCQILDYVHEDVFNQNDHVSRLKEEETLDTYIFLNSDGTKTVYYMNDAVKYRDASGTVREKNIDLIASLNGYTTTLNDVQLHIPNNVTNGVQLSYAGYDVSIVPQGGSRRPSAQHGGNSVAYPNYYGSGTALIYTPTLNGVKEDILLAQYNGVSDFTFLLNTDGLNLYHTPEDRYYLALTEDAEMKIWLGNIEIFDAETKPSMGTMTVETVNAGQQYRLTISADVDFLTDPNTVYPVTIDPTITVSDNTYGASAIEDAPIYEGYPNSNFGTYQYNRAGYAGSPYGKGRTVVRLNRLLTHSAYSSASEYNISSVIFYMAEASGSAPATVNIHPLTSNSAWSESNVTWNNVGSFDSEVWSTNTVAYGAFSSFNITALARLWKNGTYNGNCGFVMIGADENTVDKSLYSCEHSTSSMWPYVVAIYNDNLESSYWNGPYTNSLIEGYVEGNQEYQYVLRDDSLQLRANCYGYALRLFYGGAIQESGFDESMSEEMNYPILSADGNLHTDKIPCYKQQPGEFSNKELEIEFRDGNTVYTKTVDTNEELLSYKASLRSTSLSPSGYANLLTFLVLEDAKALGYDCEALEVDVPPNASTLAMEGKRLIALVVKDFNYHFYMQHSDNSWSHKNGLRLPSNTCLDHHCILSSNDVFTAHAREGLWTGGVIQYITIKKSASIDCIHNSGSGSAIKTTLCAFNNAKAVGDSAEAEMHLGNTLPIHFNGHIDCKEDIDYFSLQPNISKNATFQFTSSDGGLIATLYDASGNILYGPTNASSNVTFTRYVTAGTKYYLSLKGDSISAHRIREYSLSIS